jgi:aryl-alcohol dehydrogenase-like predicted oxidoreductase
VGKAMKIHGRDKFVIATKFGLGFDEKFNRIVCGKEDFIRSQLTDSLNRLGTDYIDLYYMHRMDPNTPIEETMAVLKSLVEEGKIRYVGLSECSPSELRRAHAVHPITAIQMEWSLQTRDIEKDILHVARELGVAIVPYSPLGRGFLADIAAFDTLSETDWRKGLPRFSGENYEKNKAAAAKFFELAKKKGCTGAQLALAWVHAQGEDVFPIPGTKSSTRIAENAQAFSLLPLTPQELKEIADSVESAIGDRYPKEMMSSVYNDRV